MFEVRGARRPARGRVAAADRRRRHGDLALRGARRPAAGIRASPSARRRPACRPDAAAFDARGPAARPDRHLHRGGHRAGGTALAARFRAASARARYGMRSLAPARRHRRQLRPRVQRVARQVARRPGAADHRARDGSLPLRGHPLVLDRVRPRRDHHRAADALARPDAGAGGPPLPRRAPGDRDLALRGRGPGQDHARDPQGRDGAAAASCRSAATTAASTRRPCSWCWPAPTPTAPGTSP